jgi:Leucine-rich repeat (LRR) protein
MDITIIIVTIVIFVIVVVLATALGTYFAGSSSNPAPPVPPTPEVVFTDVTFGSLIEDPEVESVISIDLPQASESVTIEWGDGEVDIVTTSGLVSHKYTDPTLNRVYSVRITGPITILSLINDTSGSSDISNINITDSLLFTRADGLLILGISSGTNFDFPLESQMKCKDITDLNASYNTVDVSFFYTLSLDKLRISSKGITGELPTLPSSLTYLICSNNSITILPTLPPSLADLNCSGNTITTLPTLPSSLESLNCSGNTITILPNLPSSLTYLDCYANTITTLPTLPSSLESLNCSGNTISSLPTLPSSLESLNCSGNTISSLPTLPPSLTYLNCSGNTIGPTFDVSSLTKLTELYFNDNPITEVTIGLIVLESYQTLTINAVECNLTQSEAESIATQIFNNNIYRGTLYINPQVAPGDVAIDINTPAFQAITSGEFSWIIE